MSETHGQIAERHLQIADDELDTWMSSPNPEDNGYLARAIQAQGVAISHLLQKIERLESIIQAEQER